MINSHTSKKGSSLVMVLSLVAVLMAAIVSGLFIVNHYAKQVGMHKANQQAHLQAEKGLAIALSPLIYHGDDALNYYDTNLDLGYQVDIKSENTKFNLNTLLQSEAGLALLDRILLAQELEIQMRAVLIDSLVDWIDQNELSQLNGAERNWYEEQELDYVPSNQLFTSLDEVLLVRGMSELLKASPNWQDWFTLRTLGKLDIHEADIQRLELLSDSLVMNWDDVKSHIVGLDQLANTQDDIKYSSLNQVYSDLGITSDIQEQIEPWLTITTEIHQIESLGLAGTESKSIHVWVANKAQGAAEILQRKVKVAKLPVTQ